VRIVASDRDTVTRLDGTKVDVGHHPGGVCPRAARMDDRGVTPFLLYRDPDGRRELLELTGERVTIGRRASCDIALTWDAEVSRLHAELVRLGEDWVVHDEGLSHNGTFVNGERVRGRRRLRTGDVLAVGATTIAVHGPDRSTAGPTRAAQAGEPVDVTPAQRRLLEALCRPLLDSGYAAPASNETIAHELVISLDTVKGTLTALYERFGLAELPRSEKRAALAVRGLELIRDSRCG
jgi:pSer/pThr/pTyr-binding forkhead associated (FHA) protein